MYSKKDYMEQHFAVLSDYEMHINLELEEELKKCKNNSYSDTDTGYNLVEDYDLTDHYEELEDLKQAVVELEDRLDENYELTKQDKELLNSAYQERLDYLDFKMNKIMDRPYEELPPEEKMRFNLLLEETKHIYDVLYFADIREIEIA